MASSYSALKIELMATGEDDQIWGDKTNQNWLAMQQAVSQSGVVPFASADQVLTLVDSSALQPARAARLVANGTSGGARNLTLPAIDKLTVFENQLADPVTVKVAGGGAGQVVPAGRSMPLLTFPGDVHAQFDYLPSLNTVNFASSLILVSPSPANFNGFRFESDGAAFSRLYFNYGQNTLFNYNWGTQTLTYTVNGTVAVTFSGNGIAAPYGSFTQQVTAGVVAIGDASMYFQTDTAASYIVLNGFNCRLQYTKANGDLSFFVNSVSHFNVDVGGTLTVPASVRAGPGAKMQLNPDGTYQSLMFDTANAYFQYNISNQNLYYVTAGTIRMTIAANGDTTFAANLAANYLYGAGAIISSSLTCPDIYPCNTGRFRITGTANQSYIFFDTAGSNQSYMYWDYNSTTFGYVSGGTTRFSIAYAGQVNFSNGVQVGGTFGCSAQGFFTGNLNAAINFGIAANCVMVGFFQSGAWFNMQSVGVNVNTVVCTAGYGSGASVNWSCSPSDRRLKDNIERPSLDALDVVRKLPVWSCDYIAPRPNDADLEDPEAWPEIREHWPFSFMADEVDAAMPCATIKNDGLPVALHPQHLIATLWAAVQQLTDRLESAEAKLAAN